MINTDLYCIAYVDTDLFEGDLLDLINSFLSGNIFLNYIKSKFLDISVIRNDSRDPILKNSQKDGFLFYHYYLEIDPSENVDYETFVEHTRLLVNFLRSKGFKTIPSCEFEDKLNDGKPYTEFMK